MMSIVNYFIIFAVNLGVLFLYPCQTHKRLMKNKRIKPARFINSKVIATISISLVLTLLGLIILLVLLANSLSTHYKESVTVEVFLNDESSDREIESLQYFLDHSAFAKSTRFISKEEALEKMKVELGTDPAEIAGFNPFPASIEVALNSAYSNVDSLAVIEQELSAFSNNIKTIEYEEELVRFINENITKIGFILLSFAVLLLIVSYALINNTIRLMIYSKRFIIHTMKLVGAKNSFVRGPFVRTNIIMGIIAAFIAMGLIFFFLYYIDLVDLVPLRDAIITSVSLLVLGILIPIAASYFAVNKYLKMKGNDLYYI